MLDIQPAGLATGAQIIQPDGSVKESTQAAGGDGAHDIGRLLGCQRSCEQRTAWLAKPTV